MENMFLNTIDNQKLCNSINHKQPLRFSDLMRIYNHSHVTEENLYIYSLISDRFIQLGRDTYEIDNGYVISRDFNRFVSEVSIDSVFVIDYYLGANVRNVNDVNDFNEVLSLIRNHYKFSEQNTNCILMGNKKELESDIYEALIHTIIESATISLITPIIATGGDSVKIYQILATNHINYEPIIQPLVNSVMRCFQKEQLRLEERTIKLEDKSQIIQECKKVID